MSEELFIQFALTLAFAVSGLMEGLKKMLLQPLARRWGWLKTGDDGQEYAAHAYVILVILLSFVIGLGAALIASVVAPEASFLGALGIQVSEAYKLWDTVLLGITVAFGNQFFHLAFDFARAIKDGTQGWAEKQHVPVTPRAYTSFSPPELK